MHQERTPTTVRQLLTQIQDLQNKVNSLSDAIEFHDSETGSSSGATHVSSQPLIIPSPRTMRSRDSGLPLDTRNSLGSSGNVFERLPARKGLHVFFDNSKNLASSSCELGSGNTVEHGKGVRRDPQSSSKPAHHFTQGLGNLNPLNHTVNVV